MKFPNFIAAMSLCALSSSVFSDGTMRDSTLQEKCFSEEIRKATKDLCGKAENPLFSELTCVSEGQTYQFFLYRKQARFQIIHVLGKKGAEKEYSTLGGIVEDEISCTKQGKSKYEHPLTRVELSLEARGMIVAKSAPLAYRNDLILEHTPLEISRKIQDMPSVRTQASSFSLKALLPSKFWSE